MGLYRRERIWWFTIMHAPVRIQRSTGTHNRKLAERIYAKALFDVQEGRWFEKQAKGRKFSEMVQRFDEEVTSLKKKGYQARDKSIFKHLKNYFGEEAALCDVEGRVGGYEKWRRGQITKRRRPPDSGTIRKELSLLGRMFNEARKVWKWKIQNPVSDIRLPKDSEPRVRYLVDEEDESLFEALEEFKETWWLKPMVIVALDTGLREGNLCSLLNGEVSIANRSIFIKAEKLKNNNHLGIPLTERACQSLKEVMQSSDSTDLVFHENGKPLHVRKVQRAFARLCKKAGIRDFRFHDQRHTFASNLRQAGEALDKIAELLGHKDLRMTLRYAHLSVEPLREAISRLDRKNMQRDSRRNGDGQGGGSDVE